MALKKTRWESGRKEPKLQDDTEKKPEPVKKPAAKKVTSKTTPKTTRKKTGRPKKTEEKLASPETKEIEDYVFDD